MRSIEVTWCRADRGWASLPRPYRNRHRSSRARSC